MRFLTAPASPHPSSPLFSTVLPATFLVTDALMLARMHNPVGAYARRLLCLCKCRYIELPHRGCPAYLPDHLFGFAFLWGKGEVSGPGA